MMRQSFARFILLITALILRPRSIQCFSCALRITSYFSRTYQLRRQPNISLHASAEERNESGERSAHELGRRFILDALYTQAKILTSFSCCQKLNLAPSVSWSAASPPPLSTTLQITTSSILPTLQDSGSTTRTCLPSRLLCSLYAIGI